MIKAILVDDEAHCNQSLEIELNEYCPEVSVIATYTSGEEAIEGIRKLRPDLVFLDIEMPWINGFELLKRVGKLDFEVIFITAYDTYAIEAFRYCAIDYLLKPIQSDLLQEAVEKVRSKKKNNFNEEKLSALLHNMERDQQSIKIVLPTSNSLEVVEVDEIVRCQSENNYSHVFLADGSKIFLAKSLKDIENIIRSPKFLRVHQSHLINTNYIKRYVRSDGGYILMKDESQISVSKAKKDNLMALLKSW